MKQAVAKESRKNSSIEWYRSNIRVGLLVFLTGLAISTFSALSFTQPGYMDAYYYNHVASNIASGRGFVEDYVWNYLTRADTVSHPSNLYWMPLTSLVIVPFIQLLGDSFRVAQIPFVLLSALLALFAFWLGVRISGNLRHALAASALTLFSGFYFAYWTSPDSFGLFALTANAVLLLSYGLISGTIVSYGSALGMAVLAGGFTALSHLARADGVLLLPLVVAMIVYGAWRSVRKVSGKAVEKRKLVLSVALLTVVCIAAYSLVMAPWFLRNWQLVGNVLPTAGMKTLFLQEYNDFYTYNKDLTWQSFLSWGLLTIMKSKLEALGANALVLFGMEYHLVPFAVVGLWHLRNKLVFAPFFVYAAGLYLTMSLLFTFPSGRGSMLHSSVALIPWLSLAAVVGLDRSIVWVARRLRHWNIALAQRNFTVMLIFFAVVFSSYLMIQESAKRNERYNHYNNIASWFREAGASDALIMIADPPGYYYSSGKGSIVIPSDDLDTVVAAARRYGASYLVLEEVHSRPLHPYYKGEKSDPRLAKLAELGNSQIYRIEDK